ncbi:IclR family transcriptional regulator [Hydrogenophaga sp. BPS33]|uniref:IclR family transcriptional regulator n=1 Tax=Hydrogenophaga sp. BPS33 TaxID=2651974 RepID=UPI00131FDB23|nr:IclR family transcriptional regulator C-terminal domain-containing protein [Hydrogenophaga sp. BPS33]QHE84673.1 helix-turn-helix domain-containing protein [Hydrogenophaga sp. BPS33]
MPAFVPAAARALALFEVFAREKRELSNTELAKHLNLPESSCSDLVGTLLDIGYLAKSARSRRLYPTSRLYSVAAEVNKNDTTTAWLEEACEMLRDKTGESTLCGKIVDGVVHVLAFCEGRYPLRYTSAQGEKISLHVSALGKAILALGTPAEAVQQLKLKPMRKLASGTMTELPALSKQIAQFKQNGWSLVENEGAEDLAAFAMAGNIGAEQLAISVVGPVGRIRLNKKEYLAALAEVSEYLFRPS